MIRITSLRQVAIVSLLFLNNNNNNNNMMYVESYLVSSLSSSTAPLARHISCYRTHQQRRKPSWVASKEQCWSQRRTEQVVSGGLLFGSKVAASPADDENMAAADHPWSIENLQACANLWGLTREELAKLHQLKVKLVDVSHVKNNPFDVVRFLLEHKERNADIAERRFRRMIKWRRDNDIDQLVLDGNNTKNYAPPPLYRYFPAGLLQGVDKDGDPIHLERTGVADTLGLLKRYGRDEMIRYSTWLREVQCHGAAWRAEYQERQGHPVKQITLLFDLKGLGRSVMTPLLFSVGLEVTRVTQEYYPHRTKRIIFLRAPPIFQFAWKVFRPFIDKSVQEQMIFTTSKNYQAIVELYIDPKVLPAVIHPLGQGEALEVFDTVWEGGPIPVHEDDDDDEDYDYDNDEKELNENPRIIDLIDSALQVHRTAQPTRQQKDSLSSCCGIRTLFAHLESFVQRCLAHPIHLLIRWFLRRALAMTA
jgi:hypothetical protein